MIQFSADILQIRKGFKIEEDRDTSDTYNDDPQEDESDDAWDEDEVSPNYTETLKILIFSGKNGE